MRCRIEHIGPKGSPNLSISDFTLIPGFTSPDFELKEDSPDMKVVEEWVQEGLIKILSPSSTGKTEAFSGAGGRSKGHTMTAKEVRDYMSPKSKRRRRTALSRIERNMATHKAPVGMPFGPGKNVKIFTAEELAEGKPEPLKPLPVPDENKRDIDTGEKKIYTTEELKYINSKGETAGVGGADRAGATIAPMKIPEVETLSPADLKEMNKAVVEPAGDEHAETTDVTLDNPDVVEDKEVYPLEIDEDKAAEKAMGEQPVDSLVLDDFVEKLAEMTKPEIKDIAKKAGIKLPNQINKTPLIAMVAETLAKKGYTELPGSE